MLATPPKGQVTFRVIHDADRPFLIRVYASTRAEEFRHSGWTETETLDFLTRQFDLQAASYRTGHPGAVHRIIQLDGADIGRLIVDRQDDCLRLIDLSLLPDCCGRGIGTDILRSLMNEAHGGKVPMRLHARRNGRALPLYLRHGFRVTGTQGVYVALEWRPQTGPREI